MCDLDKLENIKVLLNNLIKAKKDLVKSSKRRFDLGFNASRKQITTANAKYSTDAEYLSKCYYKFKEESEKLWLQI